MVDAIRVFAWISGTALVMVGFHTLIYKLRVRARDRDGGEVMTSFTAVHRAMIPIWWAVAVVVGPLVGIVVLII